MARDEQWLVFDTTVTVEVDDWAGLTVAVEAFDRMTRHGQVVVRLGDALAARADDAAMYLQQLLGDQTTVSTFDSTSLLIARRPMRIPPRGDPAP